MNGESQLDRYWNYVNEISQSSNGEKIYAFVLAPDYNMPVVSDYCAQGVEFKPLYYSDIYKFLSEKIECIIDDISFIAFYNALKRHTYTSKSFALYEDMKQKFYDRINLLKK